MSGWFGVSDQYSFDVDIEAIARRNGLTPQRMGNRVRFFCPFCQETHSKKKGRTASADRLSEGQPWKCWRASCGATGTARQLAAHFGELDIDTHKRFEALPKPKPRPKPREKTTVRTGWDELLNSATQESSDRIFNWATRVRGWPQDVARSVSHLDDVVCPMPWEEHGGRSGDTIFRHADKESLRLLVPIRCGDGIVRTAMRMWLGPEEPPEDKRTKMVLSSRLAGASETWGGIMVYGSIPSAIEAAQCGDPIYIVEGAPDYLAASGLLLSTNEPGVVLGAFNAQTTRKMVDRLLDSLNQLNIVAPRVVFIPDIDRDRIDKRTGETYQAGVDAFDKAAKMLRGRAGVYILKLTKPSSDSKMDLSKKLADVGSRKTLALLRTAPVLYTPPVHIDRCQAEMSARFRRAVMEATQKAIDGKKTLVVFQVEMGVGKTRNALDEAAKISTGDLYIPVNGRRPRGVPVTMWPPKDRSVVFAAGNHDEAGEKMEELEVVHPGTRVRHIYGLVHYCQFKTNVSPVFPHVGRRGVCGDPKKDNECPNFQGCPGSDEPRAYRGEVTFVAHALAPKMKADLLIIDESPGVISTEIVGGTEVMTLFASKSIPRVIKWRRLHNPEAGDAAQLLANLITPMAHQHAALITKGSEKPYSKRLIGEALVDVMDQDPELVSMLKDGFLNNASKPPMPYPDEIRKGLHAQKHMPSMSAFNALNALIDYYMRVKGEDASADDDALVVLGANGKPVPKKLKPLVGICINADGTWSLEIRKIKRLPDCPIVILDATGSQTLAEWKAAYPDRKVVIRSLEVQGSSPATALHMESPGFSRKGLIGMDGNVRLDAVPKIEKVLERLGELSRGVRPHVEGAPPTRLGILTHKPIADALLGASTSPAGIRGFWIVSSMQERGFEFVNEHGDPTIGWFGRHDRGTNAFRRVDGMVVIGDPVGNFGDIEQDAILLGLEPSDISSARTAATCRQAIARARHIRRGSEERATLIFAGRERPFLPGVRWINEALREGAAMHAKTRSLKELILFIAHAEGAVGTDIVKNFNLEGTAWEDLDVREIPTRTLSKHIKIVAQMRRWGRHSFQIPLATGGSIRTYIWSGDEALAKRIFDHFHPKMTVRKFKIVTG